MTRFHTDVYTCLFPVTRLSARAVDALLPARKEFPHHADALWPNDETFCATFLTVQGFVCRDLNAFGLRIHDTRSFAFEPPISRAVLEDTPANQMIYHPVLSGPSFLRKLRSRFGAQRWDAWSGFDFAGLYNTTVLGHLRSECGEDAYRAFNADLELTLGAQRDMKALRDDSRLVQQHTVVEIDALGHRCRLACLPDDYISSYHLDGHFYEEEALALCKALLPPGGHVLDVGAHVGNHSVFFTTVCGAARVIPVEPNPAVLDVLRLNLSLNVASEHADLRHLGIALSDADGWGTLVGTPGNSGASRLTRQPNSIEGIGAQIRCQRGDDLLAGQRLDFIKIDTSGDELAVLRGLRATIRRTRPRIMVKVAAAERVEVMQLVETLRYSVLHAVRGYADEETLFLLPI